jgi:xylan 1,4-beta-xylosidase
MRFSKFLAAAILLAGSGFAADSIVVDAAAAGRPFPHFWEQVFGSGRANLSLRAGYRHDLRDARQITGLGYVRFHAIFQDENGVYDEDAQGRPVYNFTYVDQIYDGLLENKVRPFVELSFMPRKLASNMTPHGFWYHPFPAPPKDWQRWEDLVEHFARHLVERYGVDEVAQWYFEVWNEPNIDFWTGVPPESTYYQLYDRSAHALKRVSPRLRVGGPATAQAAWVDRFISHCVQQNVPMDFVSTHVYGNDKAEDVFGTHEKIPRSDMVARAMQKVHDQVKASARPDTPIHWSEFNASYMNEVAVTDSPYMGPWLANTIRLADGLVATASYWTFSDVFEEQGVAKVPFYGGYGLIATGNIPKAAFNAFALLHRLGTERIPLESNAALATRSADGSLAIAVWNYWAPEDTGTPREYTLSIRGLPRGGRVKITRIDRDHGSPLATWEAMGRPATPTPAQQKLLREVARMPDAENRTLAPGTSATLALSLAPHGLALVEIAGSQE